MKKVLVLVIALLPAMAFGQNILNKLKNKVKNKAEERAERKIDQGIDKALDKAEGAGKPKGANKEEKAEEKETAPAEQTVKPAAAASESLVQSYSRFDFVPGEEIVYAENFEQDVIGELPTGWNTSNNGEVVTLNAYPGKWLRLFQNSTYLSPNEKEFGENYTYEFDLIMQFKGDDNHYFPYVSFAMFASGGESPSGNAFLDSWNKNGGIEVVLYPAEHNRSKAITSSYQGNRLYFRSDEKKIAFIEKLYGKVLHVAVQVQKERFRMWINEQKIGDFPKALPPGQVLSGLKFQVHATGYAEEKCHIYINNLKVAKGIPDTRHKLIEEGKFSTTGILFDVNSDVIKPESYGVVKDIAKVLQENTGVRVKIVGHTDSDGNDAANLALSEKRAAAVVKLLTTEFSIDASRLESEGKGESEPVGDNKTREGKAMNRRVEFIKL